MKIAIIGAGFAGLTTARHLRDFGHQVTVFEKVHDVGGVWSTTRLYPGVSTQNGKDTYCLSDYPMPKHYPEWPSGQQVQAYLNSYADRFNLKPLIRLSTPVTHAAQGADGRWSVTYQPKGREAATEDFDFLTICNGIFSAPAVPAFSGAAEFKAAGGTICHSSEFLNLEEARGKHVVVIGYGKSSCDVAVGLEPAASSVTVVARELIWKMPKKLGGVLNYKYLFLTRMGEALFPYITLKGVEKFLHGAGRPVRNSMLGSVQSLITKQLRLKKLNTLPRGSFERIARSTVSLVTDGFFDLVEKGRIAIKRDTAIAQLLVEGGRRFALPSQRVRRRRRRCVDRAFARFGTACNAKPSPLEVVANWRLRPEPALGRRCGHSGPACQTSRSRFVRRRLATNGLWIFGRKAGFFRGRQCLPVGSHAADAAHRGP